MRPPDSLRPSLEGGGSGGGGGSSLPALLDETPAGSRSPLAGAAGRPAWAPGGHDVICLRALPAELQTVGSSPPPPSPLFFPQLAFIAVSHFPTGFRSPARRGIYLLPLCNPQSRRMESDAAVLNTYREAVKAAAAFNGTFSLFPFFFKW